MLQSMAANTPPTHVLIVCFPAQGQINPVLRLAKRLASTGGFLVTFATTSHFGQHITKTADISPVGDGFLRFDFFDDECSEMDPHRCAPDAYLSHLECVGRKNLTEMIRRLGDEGRPVSCLISGTLVPWASDVAGELGIPSAMLWVQSCASFLTFYHCYNELVPFPTEEDAYIDVQIPTLPLLKWDELHSFLHPTSTRAQMRKPWLREFGNLNKHFCILMETFEELEHDTVHLSSKLSPTHLKPIGPLFKNPKSAVRIDQLKADFDSLRWLDSKPPRSVIYVSFGSYAHLKQEQINEIAHGISNIGAPFLWVMMPPNPGRQLNPHTLPEGFLDKVGDNGKVVDYSPQEEVLGHPSVGCFMTHCGWNSTMEALSSGVPMVAFPRWGDQLTNAKYLVDVWGLGVRMGRGEHGQDTVVTREDVEKCIREATVGPKAEEMRRIALAWKRRAEKACQEGGSSDTHLKDFVNEVRRRAAAQVAVAPGI